MVFKLLILDFALLQMKYNFFKFNILGLCLLCGNLIFQLHFQALTRSRLIVNDQSPMGIHATLTSLVQKVAHHYPVEFIQDVVAWIRRFVFIEIIDIFR